MTEMKNIEHNIHINENFMSSNECEILLNFSKDNPELYGETSNDFWTGRTIYVFSPNVGKEIQDIGLKYLKKAKTEIMKFSQKEVWPDILGYSKWWDGYVQRPHADGENPDGSQHEFHWRKFGCVYYLNDDYEGGEIWFPNFDISIKPKPNTMIFFPGDLKHLHGVRNVDKGVRHTMASFWAYEFKGIDV